MLKKKSKIDVKVEGDTVKVNMTPDFLRNTGHVKLSTIISLSDDVAFYRQEARCGWMNKKFIMEHLDKHHKAHSKLVKALLTAIEDRYLEIDV